MDDTLVRGPVEPSAADDAFDQLYRASRDDVYAYVATLLRDRNAAEDVTALAFERAYRKRGSFRAERGSRRAWLFGIARNAALDELRRRRRTVALPGEPSDALAHEEAVDRADRALRQIAVRDALRSLSTRERELIALKFHGGLTNTELGRVLGLSETNAGSLLHRTIQKLRKACDEVS